MSVVSSERVAAPLVAVAEPMVAFVVQGAKRSVLGERTFDYHAGQYVVVSVDLPLTSQIIHASPAEPFQAVGMALEPAIIAQLLLEAATPAAAYEGPAVAVSDADEGLLEAVVRLLRLLDDPRDHQVLGPGVRREIHWRLMNGPQGAMVRQIGSADSRMSLVARAVKWLRPRYNQVIRMEDLAGHLGVSISSLNRHFRAVTAMSPLQYQKQLRLQAARIALIAAPHDVATVGYSVGYDSPSQFSREYRRMYGLPPAQDAARLQVELDPGHGVHGVPT
ncbi:AraC family transcriptional regulator [Nonomuraea aridisoli]|uniref:AraC family transcriptional regulator n=1 Tax=Nonomuraea aridisoli TaxID=2070368 RepID=A0A2W2EXS3_9ACTN|nr:AraC family transcriptional regulator [Nonomuraea aridisoli]